MSSNRRRTHVVCSRAQHPLLAILAACLLSAAPASAQASEDPTLPLPPPKVSIKDAVVIGNCTGTPTIAPDRSDVKVKLHDLSIVVGGEKVVDSDHCQLVLTVEIPEGYEYAPTELHGAGTVTLAQSVSAGLYTAASFSALDRMTHRLIFNGPTDRTFTLDAGFGDGDEGVAATTT